MNKKVERIIQEINKIVSTWSGIESLLVMENENDSHDPYFFLSFDVYYHQELPNSEFRQQLLAKAGAFETNSSGRKDRFLIEEVAVRLEFKSCSQFGLLPDGELARYNGECSTYSLYRLLNGRILYQKSDWISKVREAIQLLGEKFWIEQRDNTQLQLEHCLADMEAARIRQDRLFYTLSLAGFLERLCGTLYALNHRLEPNHRLIRQELLTLPVLPETFIGSLDILLRFGELPLERHCEIASLLTRQVVAL